MSNYYKGYPIAGSMFFNDLNIVDAVSDVYNPAISPCVNIPYDLTYNSVTLPANMSIISQSVTCDSMVSPSVKKSGWYKTARTKQFKQWLKDLGKAEETLVEINSEKINNYHVAFCKNKKDLSSENIMLTLAAIKSRLIFDTQPLIVTNLECDMTTTVKAALVEASKRLRRYGKPSPIVPSFDENAVRLPDTLKIGDHKGIVINIIDDNDHGELYLSLKATGIVRSYI